MVDVNDFSPCFRSSSDGRKMGVGGYYDHYVSLGENCEAAFNFRRLLGKDISYYFNWLVTPLDSLLSIIDRDFDGDFLRENLYYKTDSMVMVTDKQYGISYHNPFKDINGSLSGEEFELIYNNFLGKLDLFKRRFYALGYSDLRVLYFVKTRLLDPRQRVVKLREILKKKFPSHVFDILVLQEKKNFKGSWEEEQIFNRYLDYFAPYNNVPAFHKESWDRIFAEFPLSENAVLQALC